MLWLNNKPVAIYSDFDGTITQRDVIVMIMEAFAPPVWRDIVDQILNQRTLSIRDGVTQLFRLIPGSKKREIEGFVTDNVQLREGFAEMLTFCEEHGVPFQVLSGGVDFFVHRVLAPFEGRLAIYCNGATFPESGIELTMPYYHADCAPCGQCACCKIALMDRPALPGVLAQETYRIAIGDSLTDLPMARVADWTFARGQLVDYCREESISVTPYETFHDIIAAIRQAIQPERSLSR